MAYLPVCLLTNQKIMPITTTTEYVNVRWPYTKRIGRRVVNPLGNWSYSWNTVSLYNPGQGRIDRTRDTDWKVKIAKGENASNPYLSHWFDLLQAPRVDIETSYRVASTKYHGSYYDTSISGTNLIAPNDPVLYDQALARYKRKLSGTLGGAKALVPAVELRELRKTIRGAATLSTDLLLALAKARKTRGRSLLGFFQSQWLSYSFAISPMISDIESITTAIQELNDSDAMPSAQFRIRGSKKREWETDTRTVLSPDNYSGIVPSYSTNILHSLRYNFDSGIDFAFITGNNYGLKDHLGFTNIPAQLPSIGWELFPFSWVGDYFSTMGAYLEDTFVLPPGSTKYLTSTQVYEATGWHFPSHQLDKLKSDIAFTHYNVEPGRWKYHYVKRLVLTNLPYRSLRFKTADEIGINAVNRLLNLASLIKVK